MSLLTRHTLVFLYEWGADLELLIPVHCDAEFGLISSVKCLLLLLHYCLVGYLRFLRMPFNLI